MPTKRSALTRLAMDEAMKSEHRGAKHGALLAKKGKVICCAHNRYCGQHKMNHFNSKRIWSMHAEMSLLGKLPKHVTMGADLYIVRVGNDGDTQTSKPCDVCTTIIVRAGIKNVYYS